jgi:hypothetical protein
MENEEEFLIRSARHWDLLCHEQRIRQPHWTVRPLVQWASRLRDRHLSGYRLVRKRPPVSYQLSAGPTAGMPEGGASGKQRPASSAPDLISFSEPEAVLWTELDLDPVGPDPASATLLDLPDTPTLPAPLRPEVLPSSPSFWTGP